MRIKYSGWSSISLDHCGIAVGFDLFGPGAEDVGLGAQEPYHLCISHGHPEHCGHIGKVLQQDRYRQVRLYSSQPVVDFARTLGLEGAQLQALPEGREEEISGFSIASFAWRHMPLLPPESFKAKVKHLLRLSRHPLRFVSEFISGLGLPISAPTLGFRLRFPDGVTVLNYAEGLHRLTLPEEVEKVASRHRLDILIAGLEGEDREIFPRWIQTLDPRTVVLFEPHGPWRRAFGFPETPLLEISEEIQKIFPNKKIVTCFSPGEWELG